MRRGEKPPEVWLKPHRGGFPRTSFCSRRWRDECVFNYAVLNNSKRIVSTPWGMMLCRPIKGHACEVPESRP
jgi:hypothetical protein